MSSQIAETKTPSVPLALPWSWKKRFPALHRGETEASPSASLNTKHFHWSMRQRCPWTRRDSDRCNNVPRQADHWCSWFWGCPKACWREAREDGGLSGVLAAEQGPSLLSHQGNGPVPPRPRTSPEICPAKRFRFLPATCNYRSQAQTCPNLPDNPISSSRQQPYINIY